MNRNQELENEVDEMEIAEEPDEKLSGDDNIILREKKEFAELAYIRMVEIDQLRTRNAELEAEVARLKDFRGGTIHNSWLTAPREKLIEALQFQGATTKEAFKLTDEYRSEVERLRKAHIELAKEHGALLETLFKMEDSDA